MNRGQPKDVRPAPAAAEDPHSSTVAPGDLQPANHGTPRLAKAVDLPTHAAENRCPPRSGSHHAAQGLGVKAPP
jgi:hypothetical protein